MAAKSLPVFSRPSVNLDRPQRSWGQVLVKDLSPGDTVAGLGSLVEASDPEGEIRHLTFPERAVSFPSLFRVLAFSSSVRKEDSSDG